MSLIFSITICRIKVQVSSPSIYLKRFIDRIFKMKNQLELFWIKLFFSIMPLHSWNLAYSFYKNKWNSILDAVNVKKVDMHWCNQTRVMDVYHSLTEIRLHTSQDHFKSKYRENRLPIFNNKCDIILIFDNREMIYYDCKKILDISIANISK